MKTKHENQAELSILVNKGFSCTLTRLAKPGALVFLEVPRERDRKKKRTQKGFLQGRQSLAFGLSP